MTPGIVNFVCPQGTTFRRTITYKLDEVPVDLTGYSARLQVRQNYYSDEYVVNINSGSAGGITIGGSAGTIDLFISDDITTDIPAGSYLHDLEIVSPSNIVDRLIEGTFTVTPEVTR